MNKKLLSVAVVAALAVPTLANAGAKTYGQLHVAVESVTVGSGDAQWAVDGKSSKANKFGIKGSTDTDLMDFKAVYQYEIGLKQDVGAGVYYQRDTWVGMSSKSVGTVRMGTIITAWKSSTKSIDPLFTTALEGRGFLDLTSGKLAGGSGDGRGRSTRTIRYDSPSIAGAKIVGDYNMSDGENNVGVGVRFKSGPIKAFVDYKSIAKGNFVDDGAKSGTATKVGAKYAANGIGLSVQYEIDGGAVSGSTTKEQDNLFLNGTYTMGATTFILTAGNKFDSSSTAKDGYIGWGAAVSQQVAKKVALYVGYGATINDSSNSDNDVGALALGMKAGF